MNKEEINKKARKVVDEIEYDLMSRSGIADVLMKVDADVRQEIRSCWISIISDAFKGAEKRLLRKDPATSFTHVNPRPDTEPPLPRYRRLSN